MLLVGTLGLGFLRILLGYSAFQILGYNSALWILGYSSFRILGYNSALRILGYSALWIFDSLFSSSNTVLLFGSMKL